MQNKNIRKNYHFDGSACDVKGKSVLLRKKSKLLSLSLLYWEGRSQEKESNIYDLFNVFHVTFEIDENLNIRTIDVIYFSMKPWGKYSNFMTEKLSLNLQCILRLLGIERFHNL